METTEPRHANEGHDPTPENGAEAVREKKPRGFWRQTRRVVAWLLLVFLILVFASALFIQLPVFKRIVVNQSASAIENSTNGTLTVGDIQGNLLEGFVMNDVTLRLKTGTPYDSIPLIHVDRILASYSLLRWIRTSEIGISSMVLQHPVVRFVKFSGDTAWNFSLLTKAVPAAPNGPPKPFTQIVDITHFDIHNGSLFMRNYNLPAPDTANGSTRARNHSTNAKPGDAIDWRDVQLENIDLESKFYTHGSIAQSARVYNLRFLEKKSGFYAQHIEFAGYLDSDTARLENVKITTAHSAIGLSVKMAHPKNIMTGGLPSMQHSAVTVSVNGQVINTAELQQFLPKPLGFLGGSPGIVLDANGEFGKLHIKQLILNFRDRGSIAIAGELDNLHHPDSLTMNVGLQAKNLSNATLDGYVPGLHLPDLSRCGTINIPNLTYAGAPLNFHAKFDAKSSGAGDAAADVILDLRNRHIQYRAGLKTNNFNVAALVHGDEFESSISAETQLAGHGTNWKTMESTVTARTDAPSSFGKYRVASLDLSGAIHGGTITSDRLDAVVEGGPDIHIRSAMIGLTSPELPFRFDGTIQNFLLAQAIESQPNNPARVDLDANITGTAKDFDDVFGTATVRLFNLEYQGHPIPEDTATISISEAGPNENKLLLHSSMVDLTIDRQFRTGDLIRVIPSHIAALITAMEYRDFQQAGVTPSLATICTDSMNFDYNLQIKDLRPLADFIPQSFLLAQGQISGQANGCRNGNINFTAIGDSVAFILRQRISLDSSMLESTDSSAPEDDSSKIITDTVGIGKPHATIASLMKHRRDSSALSLPKFGSGTPRIQLMPTNFRISLQNLSNDPNTLLNNLDAKIEFETDSVLRLGSALLYYPTLDLAYNRQSLSFNISSLYNNAVGIHLNGAARFPNGDFDFVLDTMQITYRNPYYTPGTGTLRTFVWKNEGPSEIHLMKSGLVQVDTLNIIHPLSNDTARDTSGRKSRSELMSFGGILHNDSIDAWADFPSFSLEDLKKILPFNPNAKTFDFAKYHGTVRDFRASLSGTLERPDIAARLFVDSMSYSGSEENEITFDSNYVDLSYHDQELRGTMEIHVANVAANTLIGINPNTLKGSELRATIDSIPMVLAFERGPSYAADSATAANRPISASIRATQFPLDIATPFLQPFRQIDGTGDINFTITGTREHIDYAGQASIQQGDFLLAATNMWYRFGGPITFAHNALVLQNDSIHNFSSDDPLGSASLNGSFTFNGFDITNFDLRLRSDRLMVLSDAAKEALPMAYGPVTINTGGGDFRFYNTFEAPWIMGTINILNASITMPQTSSGPQSASGEDVIYETLPTDSNTIAAMIDTLHLHGGLNLTPQAGSIQIGDVDDTLFPNWMKNIYRNDDGSTEQPTSEPSGIVSTNANPIAPSFTDKLRMDLNVKTQGHVTITIPLPGSFGILHTQLFADLESGGNLQIERGNDLTSRANGSFELSTNSTFSFLQTFNITRGSISFIRDFGNPQIDVEAEYTGTERSGNYTGQAAKVKLDISGSKNHPSLAVYNYIQPTPGGEFDLKPESSPELAEEDAIYFLGAGAFKSDLTNSNASAVSTLLPSLSGQLAGNLLENLVGSTSSQFAIRSASLNVGTLGAQVSGVYRDVNFKLASGLSNTGPNGTVGNTYGLNIETDIPLTDFPINSISSSSFAREALIEFQYNPNPTMVLPGSPIQQPIFLTKIVWTGLSKLLR